MTPPPVMAEAWIGRRTAAALVALFLAFLVIPGLDQLVVDLRAGRSWRVLGLFREKPTHESLKAFEDELARESDLGARSRVAYQSLLTRALGEGNEKILVGRDGWLFYRKEVDMVTGPGFLARRAVSRRGTSEGSGERHGVDPVAAIADYGRRLASRGIRLVFVPIPVKPFIYPEKVWAGYPLEAGPAWNRDRESFKAELAASGVEVIDLADALWRAKDRGELYLRRDTHWSPLGLGVAADRLVARLLPPGAGSPALGSAERRSVTHVGDLLRMIELGPGQGRFPPQTVEIEAVPARGGDEATVLVLGDSFTNVYSRRELEWGEQAGLGEQLMRRLGSPVQVLALNGGGATGVRELLARKPETLRQKKIVIWACSARDLYDESAAWEIVPLPEP